MYFYIQILDKKAGLNFFWKFKFEIDDRLNKLLISSFFVFVYSFFIKFDEISIKIGARDCNQKLFDKKHKISKVKELIKISRF